MAKIIADFRTSLATKLAVGGTSFTLQSATDDDGVALPAGKYYFTCDGENSQKEHFYCDLAGANATNVQSVSRQGVKTSGAVREHRVGATITITDFAHIKDIADFVDQYDGKWMGAVADYAALLLIPTPNDGEVRVTLDDSKIYVYDLDTTTWNLAGAGGGAGTVYRTTLLGTESTGDDNKTFTLTSGSFPDKKYFQVYKNGVLMGEGATNDYIATGSNQAVFNEAVLDDDVIDLLVISVDLYNPAWNQVNADILPDITETHDIGSTAKKFKDVYASGNIDAATFSGDGSNLDDGANGKLTSGTAANELVRLDANAKLPAVDGSNLTGIQTFTNAVSISASDNLKYSSDAEKVNTGSTDNTYRLQKKFTIYRNGVIRIKFDAKPHSTNATCYAQLFINGAAVGIEHNLHQTSGPVYATYSQDLPVKFGDTIELWTKRAYTAVYVRNYRLYFDRNITADGISNLD